MCNFIFFPLLIIGFIFSCYTKANPYESKIKFVQGEGIGDPYNTIHLDLDITNSPCQNTNDRDRFEVVNEVQQSVALAAIMSGRKVWVNSTGICNSANIETINSITIGKE